MNPTVNSTTVRLGEKATTSTSATRMEGSDSITSIARITSRSKQPPK